jgi:adenine-specific DNA-methyltransferase
MTYSGSGTFSNGWLAFELGVLRRLKFASAALPFTGEPNLSLQLKRWNVRVAANDPMIWSFTKATALVENFADRLTQSDMSIVLNDAYVPRDRQDNPALSKWFNETDAWWLDNVRFNAERLDSEYKRAIALTVGMLVGDYALSFDKDTRILRQPLSLSKVFEQLIKVLPSPYDNSLRNVSTNQDVRMFVAERQHTDLLFLRLPSPILQSEQSRETLSAWREEWMRGGDDFWNNFQQQQSGKLGAPVQSKQQYLGFVEDLLKTASHIPIWAIAQTENGFISNEELVETVGRIRKVDAIYTKDFSDLLGVRASIVTAGKS